MVMYCFGVRLTDWLIDWYIQVGPWSGVVQTIANADGTVSIVHVDPNNPVITLPDGTQAQVHTLADNKQWKSDIKHR